MKRIGIVAALPGELKPLVRSWKRVAAVRGVRKWTTQRGEATVVAACAGMGEDAVLRALAEAERDGPVDLVISIGWAGSCEDGLKVGQVAIPTKVIDVRTGEQFQLNKGKREFPLVSTSGVVNRAEKERLRKSYGAVMVDMEAATLVRMTVARNIPVLCMKAISDGAREELPDFNRFMGEQGQLRLANLLLWLALHPAYWPAILRLRKYSAIGATQLSADLNQFLETMDVDGVISKGHV